METLRDEMRRVGLQTPIIGMSFREGEREERLTALKALITAKTS
jgi:hypothetical protein